MGTVIFDLRPTVVLMSTRVDASCSEAGPLRKAHQGSLIENGKQKHTDDLDQTSMDILEGNLGEYIS